jgi:hypothetical protein
MKKLIVILILGALCTGCAATKPKPQEYIGPARSNGSKNMAQTVEMLRAGDTAGASRLLNAICSGSPIPGVTDEALFRLALLSLKPTPERPATRQGRLLLKRLKREYPSSPWTTQAAPLVQLINAADELRRQNRTLQRSGSEPTEELKRQNKSLKATNDELTRQINELNRNLEKLKHLDLELEQKNR